MTDLSDSTDEEEGHKVHDAGGIVIPDSFLRHLSKKRFGNSFDVPPNAEPPLPTNALVLYRPLPPPAYNIEWEEGAAYIEEVVDLDPEADISLEDDAMEVEPL